MGKLFGIVLIVLAVWFAVEVYTKGSDQAFGGALTWLGGEEPAADGGDDRSTARRFEDNVRGNIHKGAARGSGVAPETELAADDVMSGDADDLEE
jgi:hypothetical protein